jgi:hypothetical protein
VYIGTNIIVAGRSAAIIVFDYSIITVDIYDLLENGSILTI